jgi:hypothetical protein
MSYAFETHQRVLYGICSSIASRNVLSGNEIQDSRDHNFFCSEYFFCARLLVSRQEGGSVRDASLLHLCRSIARCSISHTFRRGKDKGEAAKYRRKRVRKPANAPHRAPDFPLCRQDESPCSCRKERMTLFETGMRAIYLITSLYAMHYT